MEGKIKVNKKTFFNFKNVFYKGWIKDYLAITVGSFLIAFAYIFFFNPYKITPGGVNSIGIVVNYVTQGLFTDISFLSQYNGAIPIGIVALAFDIPLFFIGWKIIGPKFGPKTLYGILTLSTFMNVLQYYFNYDILHLSNDLLLTSLYGGVVVGIGAGMIFRTHATSGGTDVLAMIMAKVSRTMSIGKAVLIIDTIVILFSATVFGEWQLPLYSILSLAVTSKIIDIYLEGFSVNKAVMVISDKNSEIETKILEGLERGGTLFNVKGMYSKKDKTLIFTVINRREVFILKDFIKIIDPNAFIVLLDAHETIGEGFKSIHEEN